jgi:hypothetical protein
MSGSIAPTPNLSIREQALEALVTLFKTMTTTLPVDDPYPIQFDFVQRAPLDEKSWQKRYTMGVHDVVEKPDIQASVTYRKLAVVCEFRCQLYASPGNGAPPEDPSVVGNMMLGALQRRLYDNSTGLGNNLGGLIVYMEETGNEIFVTDFEKRQLSGALFIDLYYRTRTTDPRFQS